MNKPVNLYQATRCVDAESFSNLMKYQTGNLSFKAKSKETDSMKILADMLYSHGVAVSEMDGFFLSVNFRFGKEFDLLKLNDTACLNIELKSTLKYYTPEQAEQKILNQLRKNRHYLSVLDKKLFFYTVVTDTMDCYQLKGRNTLNKIDFSEIAVAVKRFAGSYVSDIESLFKPSEYLVSPLNHSQKFIEHSYFLTHDQEEKKKEILARLQSESVVFGLTGEAGTGKTLMLYDIARELAKKSNILIIHCASEIPVGLASIGRKLHNLTILRPKDLNQKQSAVFLADYDFILMDETQRAYSDLLSEIHDFVRKAHKSMFLSYDSRQTLSVQEENQNVGAWAFQHCDKIYTLKNTIRTNAEVMHFIRKLHNLNYHVPARIQAELPAHICLCYANDRQETDNFIDYYRLPRNGGYIYISPDSCHDVIGQEFDNVLIVMDNIFYYDEYQKLCARDNQEYLSMHMLYQVLTRAREKLVLIITDKNLFQQLMTALGEEAHD